MTESLHPRGRYFEEFEIGDTVETPTRTITETDVVLFAGLTGDYSQLHTDAEFAKGTMFGERVAHGLLGLSIAVGLTTRMGYAEATVVPFAGLEWKFNAPIKFGDTIRVQFAVQEKEAMPRLGGGFITFKAAVLNQRGNIVQEGTWRMLIKSAP